MENSFIILISYLMGSIPFGFILTKLFLKKILEMLDLVISALQMLLRTGNKYVGYGTLFLDVLKAIITLVIIKLHYSEYIYISALSIFLGHIFPVWLKFERWKRCCYASGYFILH